jgi:integrase
MACRVGEHPKRQHLYLRLWWRGRETWERTRRQKTRANRDDLARIADLITAEIRAGRFTPERYLHYFPDGARQAELETNTPRSTTTDVPPPTCPTLSQYYSTWISRFEGPEVRPSRARDYRLNLVHYVLPRIGHLRLGELRTRHLRDLRTALLREGLAAKTVKNIIGSSLRALVRDAIRDEILAANPFVGLEWERTIRKKPDPFTAAERDKILGWFAGSRRWYYPFVFTLFHTGLRPSEAAALRLGDLDLGRGTLDITKSRHLGAEHPPKTSKSERTIKLPPAVVAVLRGLMPLHVDPAAYLFTNAKNGGPIDQSEFGKTHWQSAMRVKAVKPRKFYATRSTFISLAVPKTRNLKALADYCGTSVAMIEQHYGRYMGDEPDWIEAVEPPAQAVNEAKPVTGIGPSLVGAENPLWNKASPTGFEPVLPT